MKQYVICYLSSPVTDISSYGYVKAIYKAECDETAVTMTNDPKAAQKFGAEANEVVRWLANMTDANTAFRVLEFKAHEDDTAPQCQPSGLLYICRETGVIIGHTGVTAPGVNSIEYYLGKDMTDSSKLIGVPGQRYQHDLRKGDIVTQVQWRDETIICATTLLIKFV